MNEIISQIFISDHSNKLPRFLEETTSSIKNIFKDSNHKIYTKESLREFIKANYNSEILWAYDKLKPYSYKSDLGRFCILYKTGGWYIDIAIKCLSKIEIKKNVDMICFRDEQRHSLTSWAVAGGMIWAKPKNIIFKSAIESVLINCKEEWYGRTPLCPTGPSLLGEAIAKNNRGLNIIVGDLIRPKVPFSRKNIPFLRSIFKSRFILPGGKAIALVKPSAGGDLKSLGVKGSNNYNDFWHSRDVYKDIEFRNDYQ